MTSSAQALETWECLNITGGMELPPGQTEGRPTRETCITNPSTDIAGLMAVLPRLLALPARLTTAEQRVAWRQHLAALPPLPVAASGQCLVHDCTPSNETGRYSHTKLVPVSLPALGSAAITALKRNVENTELYAAQPFRLVGVGKPGIGDIDGPHHASRHRTMHVGIEAARQAYVERTSVCNKGWCQDLIQAAVLNLTDDATNQLVERAAIGPVPVGNTGTPHMHSRSTAPTGTSGSFRFRGFTPDEEAGDNQPNNNQLSGMRTGLNKMLMAPVDDDAKSVVLFPSFPTDRWSVRFKLHAPLNTTIEASCQRGRLEYLVVIPPARKADVRVVNCHSP